MVLRSIFFYLLAAGNGWAAWDGFRDGFVWVPILNLIVAVICTIAFCQETS